MCRLGTLAFRKRCGGRRLGRAGSLGGLDTLLLLLLRCRSCPLGRRLGRLLGLLGLLCCRHVLVVAVLVVAVLVVAVLVVVLDLAALFALLAALEVAAVLVHRFVIHRLRILGQRLSRVALLVLRYGGSKGSTARSLGIEHLLLECGALGACRRLAAEAGLTAAAAGRLAAAACNAAILVLRRWRFLALGRCRRRRLGRGALGRVCRQARQARERTSLFQCLEVRLVERQAERATRDAVNERGEDELVHRRAASGTASGLAAAVTARELLEAREARGRE